MARLPKTALLLASSSLLAACTATAQPLASAAPAPAASAEADPIAELVEQVAIPHQSFQLDNGLTVLVHEDRKAPIVAVSVWYNVGSKDEPEGKTGFAHLFEHLMFNGSENLPGDYFEWTEQIGATALNGTTWFDRTNYFQNVPTGALERALFMESDRMGYLLGAVTQEKLTNQIGVVQNEKRQGDNQPGGLVYYEVLKALFPEGHPYRHSTIGSMADLSSATMGDVQQWFIDKYGPNNAVLVLAGDIDAETARPLVEKYFGQIERGPVNTPAEAEVPTLETPKRIVMRDRVPNTRITKYWAVPGIASEDREALTIAAQILGGLASSRVDEQIVRGEEIANFAFAGYSPFHRVGTFQLGGEVKSGIEANVLESRLQTILTEFVLEGPSEEEVDRAVTNLLAGQVKGLEQVGGFGGKANALAEGLLYNGDSNEYAEELANYAALTPEDVRAAAARWLARPSVTITLAPGERAPYEEATAPAESGGLEARDYTPTKRELPPIGQTAALDFPDVSTTTLSNGATVYYAQRDTVPVTSIVVEFDAGRAADASDQRGLSSMVVSLLEEGAGGMDAQSLAEAQESLGASIAFGNGLDETTANMSTLSANLAPSLDLFGTMLRAPDFEAGAIERVRSQTLAARARSLSSPNGLIADTLPLIIYGEDDPYGGSPFGSVAAIEAIDRDDLVAFHAAYLRPDNMEIYVVSDLALDEVTAALEAELGDWQPPATPRGEKAFPDRPTRPDQPSYILVDRPDSPQSIIAAAQLLPVDPTADLVDVNAANEALGGSFLSRINMDLRETKGWSYGVRGRVQRNDADVSYLFTAPVQADRTADSILALQQQTRAFLGEDGVREEELVRIVNSNIASLPGQFETSAAVLQGIRANVDLGRPMDYYETLSERYRGQTRTSLDSAIRGILDPEDFLWVIVGDAAVVGPQLDAAGIDYEVRKVDAGQ
ncbi:M16 family metallopeptidase [Sphingomicrobium astaxanthinifaciens]|uniref:M16 family metallopeptidase n=1 Tax=Sphingomicrobium astaxanthinifaciens TaxID=1227949 RepID=UPI001FCB65EA|nr:pitrilysin family protein [Sphingomicrobium astaxanthinifaciens]MCJ7420987.1 insulinase family protein [Sphingomicrobium astaxanthinifaciens]